MHNIETRLTQDGSIGLYNKELDEIYHSMTGAKKEALEKFIEPCMILNNKPLHILDICYGIGYNTKCALANFKNIELIDCVEIDKELVLKSAEFDFEPKINRIIEDNLKNPDFINFYIEDIRCAIKKLNKKYDIIFHDGFAPHKQPELWSEELIKEIIKKLDSNGLYCTYNHSKPVLKAITNTGVTVGKTIKDNRVIGTVASFSKNLIKHPLNDYELGMLETKSAITYKDPKLNLKSSEILYNRSLEVNSSTLISLSSYLKNKNQLY